MPAKRASTVGSRSSWVMIQNSPPRIACSTRSATCAGVCPVGPVKPSRIISRTDSAISVRSSTPKDSGRLRSDSMTFVSTELGQSTLTPIGISSMAISCARVSEIETTAALVAQYGPMKATPVSRPPIDAVFTTWAGVPCLRMIGRNVWMPCTTPQKFTSTTHRQSSRVWSLIRLNVETPALLHNTSTRPNRSSVVAASRSTAATSATSAVTASASPPVARMPAATASAPSLSRSATTTAEPSAAKVSASARPMPLAAPVTTATWPVPIRPTSASLMCSLP